MTGILEQFNNINTESLKYLHSELLPECTNSVAYKAFVEDYIVHILPGYDVEALKFLDRILQNLASTSQADRRNIIAAFETEEPDLFKRLYADLITHVYSTPKTAQRVRDLANKGPREDSPYFDPTLLDAVIANQSGKRRL